MFKKPLHLCAPCDIIDMHLFESYPKIDKVHHSTTRSARRVVLVFSISFGILISKVPKYNTKIKALVVEVTRASYYTESS